MSSQLPNGFKSRTTRYVKAHPYALVIISAILVAIAITAPISLHHRGQANGVAKAIRTTSSANQSSSASTVGTSSSATSSTAVASVPSQAPHADFAAKQSTSTTTSGRDVIETATLRLSVKNPSDTASTLTQMVQSEGGFVASMNEVANHGDRGNTASNITLELRVPNSDFNHFLLGTKSLGNLDSLTQSGQDVTNQHDTLNERLTELTSESQAYTRLFSKAKSMSDMVQIQKSLTQVQSEINQVKAQLHQLNRSVSFATIHVTLVPAIASLPQASTNTGGALISSLHFMKTVGHSLAIFSAWLLPWGVLAGVIVAIFKLARRRKKH